MTNNILIQTLKENPKAAAKYYQFAKEQLLKVRDLFASQVPEGTDTTDVEITDEIVKNYGDAFLINNHRSLYDFFDQQQIFVCLTCYPKDGIVNWDISLYHSGTIHDEEINDKTWNRTQTEVYAFV